MTSKATSGELSLYYEVCTKVFLQEEAFWKRGRFFLFFFIFTLIFHNKYVIIRDMFYLTKASEALAGLAFSSFCF